MMFLSSRRNTSKCLFILFITSVCGTVLVNSLMTIPSKITQRNCKTYTENFWNVYRRHFSFSKSLTIIGLYTRNHFFNMREFTDALIRHMFSHGNMNMAVTVKKLFLLRYQKKNNRPRYVHYNNSHHSTKYRANNDVELKRIMRISADTSEGYLIIVWDEEVLQGYLDERYKAVIPNPRALFAILLMHSANGYCLNWKEEISSVLMRFWEKFNVLNVIAQAPCSCTPDDIFIYHPFVRYNDTVWGLIEEHSLADITKNHHLIVNSLANMHGYPVNVSMFVRTPTAEKTLSNYMRQNEIYKDLSVSGGYAGVDGGVLANFARHMNFTARILEPSSTNFGTVLKNGSITGSLGDVVYKRVQFAGNSRFLVDYGTDQIEFTKPFSSDKICVVVPKSKRIPQWMVIFKCFNSMSWLLIILMVWFCMVFWFCYKRLTVDGPLDNNIGVLEIFGMFIGESVTLRPSRGQYIFLTACLVSNVIILGTFQGTLVTSFSTISYFKDINTLEDLDKSGLTIASSLLVFNGDETVLMRKLHSKSRYVSGASLRLVAYERNVAGLERKQDASLFIKIHFMRDDGVPLLHIAEECPVSYVVAYIVPKGSPYLFAFNSILVRIYENGLTFKWYNDIADSLIMEKMLSIKNHVQVQKPFTLSDIQSAFLFIVIGLSVACLVLFCEIIFARIRTIKLKVPRK